MKSFIYHLSFFMTKKTEKNSMEKKKLKSKEKNTKKINIVSNVILYCYYLYMYEKSANFMSLLI